MKKIEAKAKKHNTLHKILKVFLVYMNKCPRFTDHNLQLSIVALLRNYLFWGFSVLAVLSAAVDVPPGIVDVGQVAWAFLLLQFGQD